MNILQFIIKLFVYQSLVDYIMSLTYKQSYYLKLYIIYIYIYTINIVYIINLINI